MDMIAFYDKLNIALVEKNGMYFVVDRKEKTILYHGDEETCTKAFVMLMVGFIEKGSLVE